MNHILLLLSVFVIVIMIIDISNINKECHKLVAYNIITIVMKKMLLLTYHDLYYCNDAHPCCYY